MSAVPHLGFIVAAYAVTTLVLLGAAAAVLLDGRALKRALARMEGRGGGGRGGAGRGGRRGAP